MRVFGVVFARYLTAAALIAGLAFGATQILGPLPFGVDVSEILKFVSIALALILVGQVIRQFFGRMGWAPEGAVPSRGAAVDFGLAVLVLSFLTVLMLVGSR